MKILQLSGVILISVIILFFPGCKSVPEHSTLPNILFAISDDQSYPHASVYGSEEISTPAFDALARDGILFTNAFSPSPQCSPSRAAILTGRNIWQLEEAGTHGSLFPVFPVFTNVLETSGYEIGYTGKPWGPGNWEDAGWDRNPAGPEYNMHSYEEVPYTGLKKVNYAANFKEFLQQKEKEKPFFFWYGSHEPHREYEFGSGLIEGKKTKNLTVPAFLPDHEIVRKDIIDYYVEIEWFDKHLEEMIAYLKEIGEFENTIIVVTSDNGMPFPYAKANLQEFGTHVPLVISGKSFFAGGRKEDVPVSLTDLAPTFLDMAHAPAYEGITGTSLMQLLINDDSINRPVHREFVLTGRERHTHARPDNLGFPCRAIRTREFLYIRNFKPDRWPAGNPSPDDIGEPVDTKDIKPIEPGFNDVDNSPTKSYLTNNHEAHQELFTLAYGKRPSEQLFDIKKDPHCLHNIADDPDYHKIKQHLRFKLDSALIQQQDPRMFGNGDIFETYPRFGRMRNFPGFKERGKYNETYLNE